jgi:hypothetical protein
MWRLVGGADLPDLALYSWIDRIRSGSAAQEEAQTMAEYAVVLGVVRSPM